MSQPLHNLYALDILQRQGPGEWTTEPNHPQTLRNAKITLSPDNLVHPNEPPISRLIYSGFLEHVGRCVYGGIVDDPDEPRDPNLLIEQPEGRLGWCRDVLELLRDELAIPLFRWPGGEQHCPKK